MAPGADPPSPWVGVDRIRIDHATLDEPGPPVERLHRAWADRDPVVVEMAVGAAALREPVDHAVEPWRAGAGFEPWLDRLHFLVWANNYDDRNGEPVWWWGRKAIALGATEGGPADVVLPDGDPAWIDGGPRTARRLTAEAVVHAETVEGGFLTPVPDPVKPAAALDPEQLEAVGHDAGPARVVAPAGSGKTRVLTERLRHLIADRGYEMETLLAVAYNKEAQLEMAARTHGLGARIQTLNAWGYGLVARFMGRRPEVIDERAARAIVEGLVPRPVRRVNTDPYARYLEGLSLIRLGLRDPAVVEAEFGDVPSLAAAFGPYRAELRRQGVIDFDEQIYLAVEGLLADGRLRRAHQDEHRHLLVDEFQDLTPAHMLLIRLLACPTYDVFGVGDDDQTINSHVGADPRFLVDYDRYFPGASHHALEVNYRCPAVVTEAAANVLGYNRVRVAKVIRPGPDVSTAGDGLVVNPHQTNAGSATVAAVVGAWLEGGRRPEEVAVLTRVQSLLLGPHIALADAGVPMDSILDAAVLDRLGLRAALAYLRIATAPDDIDPADLIEVQRRPSRGLPRWADKWLARCHSIDDIRRAAGRLEDVKVSPKLDDLAGDLDLLAELAAGGANTRALLSAVRDDIRLGTAMTLLDSTGAAAASHLDDLEGLLQVADLHPDPGGFGRWLHRVFSRERAENGVTLSTVHRVKGREWPMVAVFGANGGIMPHRLSEDTEEERRVFHVAVTRAGSQVVVLADASRPSSFLDELDGTVPFGPDPFSGAVFLPGPGGSDGSGRARAPARPKPSIDGAGPVAAALKAWRSERAKTDGVSPYMVLWDQHIIAIAERSPTDRLSLAACRGIGPAKLESYGDDILAVIRQATP